MRSRAPVALVAMNAIWLMLVTVVVCVVLVLVLKQQSFDHEQTVNGQKELQLVVRQVESHLDSTIRSSIAQTAKSTLQELGAG